MGQSRGHLLFKHRKFAHQAAAYLLMSQIDYIPVTHAVHRLDGIVTPASAAHSISELEHQLRSSGAKALFTCVPLLDNALKAARAVGISDKNVFILPVPGISAPSNLKTIEDLISEGKTLPPVPVQKWIPGQGKRQVAYLSYSSGTSGLPVREILIFLLFSCLTYDRKPS